MAADPLEEKINKIRQQNEEIRRRYEEVEADKKNAADMNALVKMVPSSSWPERKEPPEFSSQAQSSSKSHRNHPPRHQNEVKCKKSHNFSQNFTERPPPDPKYNFLADSQREENFQCQPRETENSHGCLKKNRGNWHVKASEQHHKEKKFTKFDNFPPEYVAWRAERNKIDEARINRQRTAEGNWKREWDNDKINLGEVNLNFQLMAGDGRSSLMSVKVSSPNCVGDGIAGRTIAVDRTRPMYSSQSDGDIFEIGNFKILDNNLEENWKKSCHLLNGKTSKSENFKHFEQSTERKSANYKRCNEKLRKLGNFIDSEKKMKAFVNVEKRSEEQLQKSKNPEENSRKFGHFKNSQKQKRKEERSGNFEGKSTLSGGKRDFKTMEKLPNTQRYIGSQSSVKKSPKNLRKFRKNSKEIETTEENKEEVKSITEKLQSKNLNALDKESKLENFIENMENVGGKNDEKIKKSDESQDISQQDVIMSNDIMQNEKSTKKTENPLEMTVDLKKITNNENNMGEEEKLEDSTSNAQAEKSYKKFDKDMENFVNSDENVKSSNHSSLILNENIEKLGANRNRNLETNLLSDNLIDNLERKSSNFHESSVENSNEYVKNLEYSKTISKNLCEDFKNTEKSTDDTCINLENSEKDENEKVTTNSAVEKC